MKLLLENWKKYLLSEIEIVDDDKEEEYEEYDYDAEVLKQQQELESSYFGPVLDRAQELAVEIGLLTKGYEDFGEEGQMLRRTITKKGQKLGLDIEYLGSGSSRYAISVNGEFVIKLAHGNSYMQIQMNQDDYKLGTDSELGGIFPRVYKHGPQNQKWYPDFYWIIMEKAIPLTDDKKIVSFFPTSYIQSKDLDELEASCYKLLIAACAEKKDYIRAPSLKGELLKLLQKTNPSISSINYEEIRKDFMTNSNNFRKVVTLFKKYPNLDVYEALAKGNCGVGYDGRFVIIDSSIF